MIGQFLKKILPSKEDKNNVTDLGVDYDSSQVLNDNLFISDKLKKDNIWGIVQELEKILLSNPIFQFYILNKPIIEDKYKYDYEDEALVILSPKHKIFFVNLWTNQDKFEDYIDDFLSDLWGISNDFNHMEKIGRARTWKNELVVEINKNDLTNISGIINENVLEDKDKRKVELIISLLIWSINDIKKVWDKDPETVLEKVKRNIMLFDAEQTRFIYNKREKKVIKIQWLAWTWKTELLLHKLKDIYMKSDESKIFFTCHNKILANDLKQRIPNFFNFMNVKKQIDWNNRLWVWNAWGWNSDNNSWLYSYLTYFYQVPFLGYNSNTWYKEIFWKLLTQIKKLKENWDFRYALDFILVDESQDFPEEFFDVCTEVSKEKIYVAWDIFQNIFDYDIEKKVVDVDFVLNKCYRTEPKTLMFAHSIWMGLFEKEKFNWLKNEEWEACWYIVKQEENNLILRREPIRRFENIEINNSINLLQKENIIDEILSILIDLKQRYPDIEQEDIAIIFIDDKKSIYSIIDNLEYNIRIKLWYEVNKSYESKNKQEKWVFISNANNVKWLEFPFIICVTEELKRSYMQRNKLYTMLTRSFLESYLLVLKNSESITENQSWLSLIKEKWYIKTSNLTTEEKEKIKNTIIKVKEHKNLNDLLEKFFIKLHLTDENKQRIIRENALRTFKDTEFDELTVESFISDNIKYIP